MKFLCSVVLAFVFNASLVAAPAIPGKPVEVARKSFKATEDLPKLWASLYFAGQWDELQQSVAEALDASGLGLDLSNDTYSVVISTTLHKKEGELIRFLAGKVTEPYSQNLRGTQRFREILVTRTLGSEMESFVATTRVPDPRAEQVQAFLKTAVGGLGTLLQGSAKIMTTGVAVAQPTTAHEAVLYEMPLLATLASVTIETSVKSPDDTPAELKTTIAEMEDDLRQRNARASACLRELNSALAAAARTKLDNLPTTPLTSGDRENLEEEVRSAYEKFETREQCASDATDQMIALEDLYVAAVAKSGSKSVAGTSTHDNVALRRWNVATTGGVIVKGIDDQRAAVSDGKLERKPLRGEAIVTANVTFNPAAYDPTASRLTTAERWRFFLGFVTTPDIGIAAGIDMGIYRGFGVALGYAYMRVEESTGSVQFDATVGENVTATRKSTAGGWFVGLSYKFE